MKNDFNPVQPGLCFASCDREALRRSSSIISEPLDATVTKITHNAKGQERIKGTEKASSVHTLFDR